MKKFIYKGVKRDMQDYIYKLHELTHWRSEIPTYLLVDINEYRVDFCRFSIDGVINFIDVTMNDGGDKNANK